MRKRYNKRRDDDPAYDMMDERYAAELCPSGIAAKFDSRIGSLNERVIEIYDKSLNGWEICVSPIRTSLFEEASAFASGAKNNWESVNHWFARGADDSERAAAWLFKCYFSIKQRGKNAAGKSLEGAVQHLLRTVGIHAIPKKINCRKSDLVVQHFEDVNLLTRYPPDLTCRISCKGCARDKENDTDHEAHVFYYGEIPDKILQQFASNEAVVIVAKKDSREQAQQRCRDLGLNLVIHDFDSGVAEIKRKYCSRLAVGQ